MYGISYISNVLYYYIMKKLTKKEIGKLGLYEFQGYIGAMTSPTFGGWKGTDRLIDLLNISDIEHPKILEVGCSTGYITRYIAKKFDCEIIGIDLSDIILEIAENEANKQKLTNVRFQKGNAENIPFPEKSFDILYGEAITALMPDPIKVINEYCRVLKPNGKLATLDLFMKESLDKDFADEINKIMSNVLGSKIRIRTFQEWIQILKDSGLKNIKIYDYYDDIFKREYSSGEMIKITSKMLYYIITNKLIRKKLTPTLKFARKFQTVLKKGNLGYLIFIGIK